LEVIVMKAMHRKLSMPAAILAAATVLLGGNDEGSIALNKAKPTPRPRRFSILMIQPA
jgi:hypothetical protein